MKKIFIVMLAAISLTACRQDADFFLNADDPIDSKYNTYADQFKVIWNGINSNYMFWDIDDTDFDARYNELLPQFEQLDKEYDAEMNRIDAITDPVEQVKAQLQLKEKDSLALVNLYGSLTRGMVDKHMTLLVKDFRDGSTTIKIKANMEDIKQRPYYHEDKKDTVMMINATTKNEEQVTYSHLYHFLDELTPNFFSENGIQIAEKYKGLYHSNDATVCVSSAKIMLGDGSYIVYLWQAGFPAIGRGINGLYNVDVQQVYDLFFGSVLDESEGSLAGIILDNRSNEGGYMTDLDWVVGALAPEGQTVFFESRTKMGVGHYDYTPWTPKHVYSFAPEVRRNLAAENIPYVVLCDVNSISCAEISTYSIMQLPTGHSIGERTWGATGSLLPNEHSTSYTGVFGDRGLTRMNHYGYVTNFEMRSLNQGIVEGKGVTPDQEVLFKEVGYEGQFKAAIDYIKKGK